MKILNRAESPTPRADNENKRPSRVGFDRHIFQVTGRASVDGRQLIHRQISAVKHDIYVERLDLHRTLRMRRARCVAARKAKLFCPIDMSILLRNGIPPISPPLISIRREEREKGWKGEDPSRDIIADEFSVRDASFTRPVKY